MKVSESKQYGERKERKKGQSQKLKNKKEII